jgi:hypothetical protein
MEEKLIIATSIHKAILADLSTRSSFLTIVKIARKKRSWMTEMMRGKILILHLWNLRKSAYSQASHDTI